MSGDRARDQFVRQANIAHFGQLLEQTTDEAERALILKLLAEEEAMTSPPQPPGSFRPSATPSATASRA
jgi:hypothetical protein